MILLQQMFILFILMTVGIVCRKTGLMNNSVSKGMSAIVINIACPAFVIAAGINKDEYVSGDKLIACALAAIFIYIGLIIIAVFLPYVLGFDKKDFGTYRVMTIFSNIGFMGFPIVSATYGSLGLLYAAFFQFPFNLLFYTYGIHAMKSSSGSDAYKAPATKNSSGSDAKSEPLWKNLLNVGVLSVFASLILYLLRVHVPAPITSIITYLSSLTVPLSMMVIGYSLGGMKLMSLFTNFKLLIFSLLKLIVIPVIGVLLLKLFITDETLLGVCFIMIATPVASMSAMLAQLYGGDEEAASRGVALTTLLSVITIPLVGGICF